MSKVTSDVVWSDNLPDSVLSRAFAAACGFFGKSAFSTKLFCSSKAATPNGNCTMKALMFVLPQ